MMINKLNRAVQVLKAQHAEAMAETGLTTRQVLVLDAIDTFSGVPSQTDIVKATGMDRSTLAEIVHRIDERGLINRMRSKEDGREYLLALTASGKSALKAARATMKKVERSVPAELGANLDRFLSA